MWAKIIWLVFLQKNSTFPEKNFQPKKFERYLIFLSHWESDLKFSVDFLKTAAKIVRMISFWKTRKHEKKVSNLCEDFLDGVLKTDFNVSRGTKNYSCFSDCQPKVFLWYAQNWFLRFQRKIVNKENFLKILRIPTLYSDLEQTKLPLMLLKLRSNFLHVQKNILSSFWKVTKKYRFEQKLLNGALETDFHVYIGTIWTK